MTASTVDRRRRPRHRSAVQGPMSPGTVFADRCCCFSLLFSLADPRAS